MPREKRNQKYTAEFKKQVIETMREEHLGYRETAERFHIRHGRVQDWERIYLTEGPEGFSVERRGRGSKGRPKQRLRAENEYLKNLQALVLERERRQGKKPG